MQKVHIQQNTRIYIHTRTHTRAYKTYTHINIHTQTKIHTYTRDVKNIYDWR